MFGRYRLVIGRGSREQETVNVLVTFKVHFYPPPIRAHARAVRFPSESYSTWLCAATTSLGVVRAEGESGDGYAGTYLRCNAKKAATHHRQHGVSRHLSSTLMIRSRVTVQWALT